MTKKRLVYFDHAAATYIDRPVRRAMRPCLNRVYGNAGSLHSFGRMAKNYLDGARQQIAGVLKAQPTEIVFTGSGSESDNLALLGVARRYAAQGRHLITSQIEHKAIQQPARRLMAEGFQVDFLPVDQSGLVSVDQLISRLTDQTTLVSIIYANNEIGTIEPIAEIGHQLAKVRADRRQRGIKTPLFFHTDACQAAGYLDLEVDDLGVDLLTLNGSKVYGPKGVGLLYVRSGVELQPLAFGGDQEGGRRPGTENIAGAVGLGAALELAQDLKDDESERETQLRDYFIERLLNQIPQVVLNGHPRHRLPNNINISVLGIEGEAMLLWLDRYGIAASTGSACDSERLEPSHVITALGRPHQYAHGSLRLTLGRRSTKREVDYFMSVFPGIVKKLREMSAVNYE